MPHLCTSHFATQTLLSLLELTRKLQTHVQIFAVEVCYHGVITRQIFIHWHFQLVNAEWTNAFILSQQGVTSSGHWVAAHGLPSMITFRNTIGT